MSTFTGWYFWIILRHWSVKQLIHEWVSCFRKCFVNKFLNTSTKKFNMNGFCFGIFPTLKNNCCFANWNHPSFRHKTNNFFLGGSSIISGEKCHSFLWLQTAIFLLKEKILENFDQQFDKNVFEKKKKYIIWLISWKIVVHTLVKNSKWIMIIWMYSLFSAFLLNFNPKKKSWNCY